MSRVCPPRVRARVSALIVAAVSCTPTAPPRPPAPANAEAEGEAALPDPVAAPTNRARGDVLALTIPRADGSGLELRALAGRAVLLELSGSWAESWPARDELHAALLAEFRGELVIVVVVMDPEREALSAASPRRGVELAWDPQGALAAQLQVAALPAALILDREGRLVDALAGASAGAPQRVRDALSSAVRPR